METNTANSKSINETKEQTAILPPELLLKIISYDCFTLQDRMNQRLTCKSLESMVAGLDLPSDVNGAQTHSRNITITQEAGKERKKSGTVISGLGVYVPKGRKVTYKNFLALMKSRIFRKAFFIRVVIENFNFNPNVPEDRMNVDQLKELCESISTLTLRIKLTPAGYHQKIFDIIDTLKPDCEISIEPMGQIDIDEPTLLNLPPCERITIASDWTFCIDISEETLLTMIKKYDWLCLNVEVRAESLLKATELIKGRERFIDHTRYSFTLRREIVSQLFQLLGLSWNERQLISKNSQVKVTSVPCDHSVPYTEPGCIARCRCFFQPDGKFEFNGTAFAIDNILPGRRNYREKKGGEVIISPL